jgi:toxin ParE1/3/4
MNRYVLTRTARADLVGIQNYDREEAGHAVARQMLVEFVEAFRFWARTPGAGHQREDLAEDRPFLFWAMRDYLIIYKPGTDPLEIVMIARGSRDIPAIIKRLDL